MSSERAWPNKVSVCRFTKAMRPSPSTTTIASGAASTSCRNNSPASGFDSLNTGQPDAKDCAGRAVFYVNTTAVRFDRQATKSQHQAAPRARGNSVSAPAELDEAVEDAVAQGEGHALPLVRDAKLDLVVVNLGGHGDLAVFGRVTNRVVDEIFQDAAKQIRVG